MSNPILPQPTSSFTLSRDSNSIPVAAYDPNTGLLGFEEFLNPSTAITMLNAASATSTPGSSSNVSLPTQNYRKAVLDINISGTATVQFFEQGPGGNWYQVYGTSRKSNTSVNQVTASDIVEIPCSGAQNVQAVISSVGSTPGVVTVTGTATA